MTIGEIIRTGWKDATESDMEYVMWSRTPYPFTDMSAKEIYNASNRAYRAMLKGYVLCDFCDNIAEKNGLCKRCVKLLPLSKEKS